jgi:hypothetical protein
MTSEIGAEKRDAFLIHPLDDGRNKLEGFFLLFIGRARVLAPTSEARV